ncbi:ABC transporter substrate-binding protein [Methylomagnum ishizawai]|uniref:ABC transporter substrate-binding protein n=1 Tax=Methylomagnum ishizawai TaxID=1760988 RepID=UPI001C33A721|nr:urea ABC transporter substrate-binding protein [Methylomagnum ishizawai]BBL75534.1 urea ABC transporter substrate-binding protein [Methylomagnum ishizawai]
MAEHRAGRTGMLLKWAGVVLFGGVLASEAWWFWHPAGEHGPIRLGIIHALTGAMAISEKPMVDAELLAVEEINAQGGLLGRQIEAVVMDGASDPDTYARQAEKLIGQDKVAALIACWTSACRKTVRPVIERHHALMIYPMAYEGLEISPNIVYTGAAPNQQILPAVNWAYEHLGKRFFLVGSDYVWPHSVNAIIRDQMMALGGEVVGEGYMPYGGLDAGAVVAQIQAARPDVIFSTLVGDSNAPFYRALREAGLQSQKFPVVSFSISDPELQKLPAVDVSGHYAAWPYFQGVERKENTEFVHRFRQRYGEKRVLSDVMETAYFSVHLWARAVAQAGTTEVNAVNDDLLGQSFDAPEGIVTVDSTTRHTWRSFNMGLIREDGRIEIVWSGQHPIRPVPYPRTRSVKQWDDFLKDLYRGWKNHWFNAATAEGRISHETH